MLLNILAGAAVLIAAAAFFYAASLRRQLTTVTQSYWELRFDLSRLRARLAKLDGGKEAADPEDPAPGRS